MKGNVIVAVLVGLATASVGSAAMAQGTQESQLVLITEVFPKPGMAADYEEARKQNLAKWAENDHGFPAQVSVNEEGVYRQVSVVGSWENIAQARAERAELRQGMGGGANIGHIRTSILRTRPELSYAPENPRVTFDDAGFIRYIFLYLRLDAVGEAEDVVKRGVELFRENNIRNNFITTTSVIGYDVPMLLFRIHATDPEGFYAQQREQQEILGEELQALVNELNALTRHVEVSNNIWRRDLSYQPAN